MALRTTGVCVWPGATWAPPRAARPPYASPVSSRTTPAEREGERKREGRQRERENMGDRRRETEGEDRGREKVIIWQKHKQKWQILSV